MSVIPKYKNPHIDTEGAFSHLFDVKDAPEDMLKNYKRLCLLKLVTGMSNPHRVQHQGIPVAPKWHQNRRIGATPRVYRIEGFQRDYRGELCYRIHELPDDTFGRCAASDDVIVVTEYAVTTPPSQQQQQAGHVYGSILRMWMTDAEAEQFRAGIADDRTLQPWDEIAAVVKTPGRVAYADRAKPKPNYR